MIEQKQQRRIKRENIYDKLRLYFEELEEKATNG
jgi:hypothetical protein